MAILSGFLAMTPIKLLWASVKEMVDCSDSGVLFIWRLCRGYILFQKKQNAPPARNLELLDQTYLPWVAWVAWKYPELYSWFQLQGAIAIGPNLLEKQCALLGNNRVRDISFLYGPVKQGLMGRTFEIEESFCWTSFLSSYHRPLFAPFHDYEVENILVPLLERKANYSSSHFFLLGK